MGDESMLWGDVGGIGRAETGDQEEKVKSYHFLSLSLSIRHV